MRQIRITVRNIPRRAGETCISTVRRDFLSYWPLEIDLDDPFHVRQDDGDQFYFEFTTEKLEQAVIQFLRERGHEPYVQVDAQEHAAPDCIQCGFPRGVTTKCPNCGFRDITPCPACAREVPRDHYLSVAEDFFLCPHCHQQVWLGFALPANDGDASVNEPMIVVHSAADALPGPHGSRSMAPLRFDRSIR